MRFRVALATLAFFSLVPLLAQAQKNELAAEATGVVDASATNPGYGTGLQINYAHRLIGVPGLGLYVEVPFVAGFNGTEFNVEQLRRVNYNNYFFTPGVKVKFVPGFFLSPYLAAGVGFAHFSNTGVNGASDTTYAVDFGGGLDITLVRFLALRLEARDFYTPSPTLIPLAGSFGNQNNVAVSAGIVVRF
jgi:opacity protein-like surface antigen